MSDIMPLSSSLTIDAAQFTSALTSAEQVLNVVIESNERLADSVDALNEHMDSAAQSTEKANSAHEASAGAIGAAVEAWHIAGEAIKKVAEGLVEFGRTAIEAANAMDPKGAAEWAQSVNALDGSFMSFAGKIGKEIRPLIEGVMDSFKKVFDYLGSLDWSDITTNLGTVLKDTGKLIETWGLGALDLLTWPFRQMVGYVEHTMASVMKDIGDVLNGLGSTSIGKKLGLSEYSGDALNQTAADMNKQADLFQSSFVGAAQVVGKGLKDSLSAAIDAVAPGMAEKLGKDLTTSKKGGNTGGGTYRSAYDLAQEATAFNIRMEHEKDLFEQTQIADAQHIASIRQASMVDKQGALEKFNLAKQAVDAAKEQLGKDEGSGNKGAIAGDTAAVKDAVGIMKAAGEGLTGQIGSAFKAEKGIADELAARAADAKASWEAAQKLAEATARAAAAAGSGKGSEGVRQDAAEQAAAAEQAHAEYSAINAESVASTQATARLESQSAHEAAQVRIDAAKLGADIEMGAAKYAAQLTHQASLTKATAAIEQATSASGFGFNSAYAAAQQAVAATLASDRANVASTQANVTDKQHGLDLVTNMFGAGSDEAKEAMQELIQAQQAASEASANLGTDMTKLPEQLGKTLAEHQKAADSALSGIASGLASKALGSVGGSVLSGAEQGAAAGPAGAAAGAAAALLEASTEFKEIGDKLSPVFQAVANAFGELLSPILTAAQGAQSLSPIISMLGLALETIAPIFAGPATIVLTAIAPLSNLMTMLGNAIADFGKIFHPLQDIMLQVTQSLDTVFGPSIAKVGNELVGVASILEGAFQPVIQQFGLALTSLLTSLSGPIIDVLKDAWGAVRIFGEAVLLVGIGLGDIVNVIANPMQSLAVVFDNFGAFIDGIGVSIVDMLGTAAAAVDKAFNISTLQGFIDSMITANNNLTVAQYNAQQAAGNAASSMSDVVDTSALSTALQTLQQQTWGTTSATEDFGDALTAATNAVSNVPQMFSVATEFDNFVANGGSSGGVSEVGGPIGSSGDPFFVQVVGTLPPSKQGATGTEHDFGHRMAKSGGDVHIHIGTIQALDGNDIGQRIQHAISKSNLARGNGYSLTGPFGSK